MVPAHALKRGAFIWRAPPARSPPSLFPSYSHSSHSLLLSPFLFSYGIRGLVIDPYNELDHQRHSSMSETEYVSQMLTKIKRFAQHNDVHVWFVAHPKQLQGWKGEAPNLYDISGSAHFVNKADCGVVVHRVRNEDGPNDKVRKWRERVKRERVKREMEGGGDTSGRVAPSMCPRRGQAPW